MEEIAHDLAVVPLVIVNAYLIGNNKSWVLVDSGTPGNASKLKAAAEARFGPGATPNAIVLTHGHFDHAGSAKELADAWGVRVYVHRLEMPYLCGRSSYPPLDPTAPGFFSALSRLFPSGTVNLGDRVSVIDEEDPLPGLEGWTCLSTPGHTPGHVSFYRKQDGALLAGDALTTMDLDSFTKTVTKRPEVCRPPVPATTDWVQARHSVQSLAEFRPSLIAAGHGRPMTGAADELQRLADHFPLPAHGRYVAQPARADESGVTYVPPAPPDYTPKVAAAVVAGIAVAGALFARRRKQID